MITKLYDIKSDFDGFSRLTELADETKECFLDTVEVDMTSTYWFDANMCAPLGVIFARLTDSINTVQPVVNRGIQGVLTNNLFLQSYGYPKIGDSYGTAVPYRRFSPADERYFVAYVNKHLEGKGIPKMSEGLGRRFTDSLLEIFVNSANHSETTLGIFTCGQFFPTQQRLDFCIADAGIGIRRKIYNSLKLKLNSDTAIRWAIQDGHTTRTGKVPGGLGLKLLREFITLNGGRLQIVSDRGYWEFANGQETSKRFDKPFPGTVVNLEINTADTSSYCLSSEKPTDNLT